MKEEFENAKGLLKFVIPKKLKNNYLYIKKMLFILLTSMVYVTSYAQSYSKIVKDEEIYDFIKQQRRYLGGNKIGSKILEWDSCNLFKNSYDCFFDFIQTQNDTILTDKLLTDFQLQYNALIKNSQVLKNFKSRTHKKKSYNISIPLFSHDKKTAIIKIAHWCGDECGSGSILIFKKINDKWIKVDTRCSWIS